jgi:hypothetical protein
MPTVTTPIVPADQPDQQLAVGIPVQLCTAVSRKPAITAVR